MFSNIWCGGYAVGVSVKLVKLEKLKEHEEIIPNHLIKLLLEIVSDGILKKPILVDINTYIILDGHHRYHVVRYLGGNFIPALLIDYNSDLVTVTAWRKGEIVTKDTVIKAGLSGYKLPPKTSRHIVKIPIPTINMPLEVMGINCEELIKHARLKHVINKIVSELCSERKTY